MSLNFYFDQIENYENVVWIKTGKLTEEGDEETTMNPVTNALIWATLTVGIGKITDKNVDEFAARLRIMEKIDGYYLIEDGKSRGITDEEFIAHIGLYTNVGNETRAQWASRHFGAKPQSETSRLAYAFRDRMESKATV
jgi:hypothetical protein